MTIVVTGATGHLGRLVVEGLLDAGTPADQVVATGRSAERLAELAARGVRTAAVVYEDRASVAAALAGADTLVLVSGSEVGRRIEQHTNLVEEAVAAGVRRIVYTSITHADTSDHVLAPEHRATEELVRASGLAWTFLRNNWYSENYASSLAQARATGEILTSTGDGRVASASRADYAAAAVAVALGDGHDGRVYELTGDVAWTSDDLAATLGELLGTTVTRREVTPDEHRAALVAAGLDEGTAGFVVALDQDTARGLLAEVTPDLRDLVGRPTTPLADTLRTFV
ncbi:SDR family oxidoreductase [Cellulomonas sp. HZM]|uniref:SDR family oxidoreductase n=1 Tax=Cellulomonas sp. HZM TaxID=1454010 RepID=UPI000493B530|nr:SDR family oxidoreductase [Cellulomonas sp. HZM]